MVLHMSGAVWASAVAAVVILLCGTRLASGQRLERPVLEPSLEQTVLQPEDTLRVTCRGDRPVTWNQTSLAQDASDRVSIQSGLASDADYVSHLEIRDVSYLDVGSKICHFVDDAGKDQQASVYLFVNDTKNLLAWNAQFMTVTLSQNREGVIPCRPSHPGVDVTLANFPMAQELPHFVFDERRGFVVSSVTLPNASGTYKCSAGASYIVVFVSVAAATESVQQPSIDASDARRNAVVGQTFSLVCSVHQELGQKLVFAWEVPPASTGLKTGRIVAEPARKTARDGSTIRLVVKDTRLEDAGSFTCRVEDHNGLTNSRTVHVTVHSPSNPPSAGPNVSSVSLQTYKRSFSMRLGDSVKIVVNVESRPSPEISWFDPEGREIITDPAKHYVTHNTEQTILEILDLRLVDMGEYRVEATASSETSVATDELTFNITVNAPAQVHINNTERYYLAGERYKLQCAATGFPRPSMMWRFEPCRSSLDCPPDAAPQEAVMLGNAEEETQVADSRPFLVQSDLSVRANLSGVYWCYANNSETGTGGLAVAEHRFFVSDIAGGFGIQRSNSTVIEGDNVTLSCGGSKLDFSGPSNITWMWSPSDVGPSRPATDLPGVRVVERTTDYSYRRDLVLDPVKMTHAGLLTCAGTNVGGHLQRSSTWLAVTASQKPVFTFEANMDKSASLELKEGDRAVFNCTVSGQPTPDIAWSKDGAPVHFEEVNRIRLLDGGQRLVIATVLSSDAGNYECRASNRDGTVWGSAALQVPDDDSVMQVVVPVTVLLSLMLIGLIVCLVWKSRQQQGLQKKLTRLELEAFHSGKPEQINPDLPIDEQAELLPYEEDAWEFPKDRLILGRQIGSGAFGRVLKAEAIGMTPSQVVAVKMPKSGSDPDQIRSLMSELKIMIQLGKHLNMVNLLGAVTKHAAQGEFMVLVEYCRHGNLHQYLHRHKTSFINQVHPITGEYDATLGEEEYHAALRRDSTSESFYRPPRRGSTASSVHSATWDTTDPSGGGDDSVCQSPSAIEDGRPRFNTMSSATGVGAGTAGRRSRRTPLTTRDLIQWSYQVSRGMEYLASRKLLHGDLAARNILLAEDNIVKISDFGLSRDIYKTKDYRKKGKGLLPVKWMAIESIQESIFSTQSDIWAFGVVMWELFSLGVSPYPGMEYDVNFVRRLRDGYRMEQPKFSPQSTYQLMLDCWRETPSSRPSFTALSEALGRSLEEHVKKDYIQLNEPYQAMNCEYFTRRVDYVNTLISPDYQNVSPRGEPLGASGGSDRASSGSRGSHGSQEAVTIWPEQGTVGYTAPVKGGGPAPLVDADSYLLMSPGPESSPDEGIFSPRPGDGGAAPRQDTHFEFPPAPQVTRESPPPPSGFYNPSYHEAGKGRVPSTPKMGTKESRQTRPGGTGEAAAAAADSQSDVPQAGTSDAHYRIPVPVGWEQLVQVCTAVLFGTLPYPQP